METNCTDTEMRTVLNRTLVLIPYPDNSNISNQNEVRPIPTINTLDTRNSLG